MGAETGFLPQDLATTEIISPDREVKGNLQVDGNLLVYGTTTVGSTVSLTVTGDMTVSGTINGKLRDFISAKDYGAKADGSDDTASLQAAINAAAVGRRKLIIPAGIYYHTGLTIPDNRAITIEGEGYDNSTFGTVLHNTNTGSISLNATNTLAYNNSVVLRGIYFHASAVAVNAANIGIYAKYNPSLIIEKCMVAGHGGNGIVLESCWSAKVYDVLSFSNGMNGLYLLTAPNNVIIRGGAFNGNSRGSTSAYAGIYVDGGLGVVIDGVDCSGNGAANLWGTPPTWAPGIIVTNAKALRISNIYSELNVADNIYVGAANVNFILDNIYCQDANLKIDSATDGYLNGIYITKVTKNCELSIFGTRIKLGTYTLVGGATASLSAGTLAHGFYGTLPLSQQVLSTTGSTTQIIQALQALGLVKQS